MPRSVCNIDHLIDLSEADRFSEEYIRMQQNTAYEELGDEVDETVQLVRDAAGDAIDLLGEDYFINKAKAINHCLMQRYLGICAAGECTTKKAMTEFIETAVSVNN